MPVLNQPDRLDESPFRCRKRVIPDDISFEIRSDSGRNAFDEIEHFDSGRRLHPGRGRGSNGDRKILAGRERSGGEKLISVEVRRAVGEHNDRLHVVGRRGAHPGHIGASGATTGGVT